MSFFGKNQKIGVAFCSPHRKITLPNGKEIVDTITVDWHRKRNALAYGTNINYVEFFCDGLEVGVARSRTAVRCLKHDPQPLYLFFLDDDVLPNYDAFTKLFFRANTHPDYDIFCGVYTCKGGNPPDPLIYAGNGGGPFWDWCIGDLLTTEDHGITGVHMGLTLIRTSLFRRMIDAGVADDSDGIDDGTDPLFKTVKGSWKTPEGLMQSRSGTEDLWFCAKAEKVGVKIMVDTSVLAGHIDKTTGITWGLPDDSPPVRRAKWLRDRDREENGRRLCPACQGQGKLKEPSPGTEDYECKRCNGTGKLEGELKIALDIGFGGHKREWPGYKTYTTDIRVECKPNYVQDTLHLNLPDNHFDLTASSHHLEHIGRWDQEQAWSEIYRVTKPGGLTEHIVPNLEWAAAKMADGQIDEHVLNVIYGAQEAHGYEARYNLHFFGYTKAVAKALAETAGFVDVEVTDWRDKEEYAYEILIRGKKPEVTNSQ